MRHSKSVFFIFFGIELGTIALSLAKVIKPSKISLSAVDTIPPAVAEWRQSLENCLEPRHGNSYKGFPRRIAPSGEPRGTTKMRGRRMNRTVVTGFPRMGENRELKKALEGYWAGKISREDLEKTARQIRKKHWLLQKEKGIDLISCNDFSLYDGMLDTAVMLGAIPKRFREIEDETQRYFAMARGNASAKALEMTKWFNTNYHYIVPELSKDMEFHLNAEKILSEFKEARDLGLTPKINIIGPLTFLHSAVFTDGDSLENYFSAILEVYEALLARLANLDSTVYVQFEEPVFVKDPAEKSLALLEEAYGRLAALNDSIKIIVTTYFEHSNEATAVLARTPIWGIGLDFIHGPGNGKSLNLVGDKILLAGVVDGRNVWAADIDKTVEYLNTLAGEVPKERIIVSTSCSLLHVPFSLGNEGEGEIGKWLSFACEKIEELVLIGKLFHNDTPSPEEQLVYERGRTALMERGSSTIIHNEQVEKRMKEIGNREREGAFPERILRQRKKLNLPPLPTTTIGSYPQTKELRKIRALHKRKTLSTAQYEEEIKKYIDDCIAFQEEIGLDVLVHGEPERNDMVEYFGELLEGFHFTANGWVQSYGSRCVKPPIIFGDISRPAPMTVKWLEYAQSRTKKIVKGMLTGPVTILNWSFVRDDKPRDLVSRQIALALADEIADLQRAGIRIIQVDEAAFKEGYPLRKADIPRYEEWAVSNFKLAVSSAAQDTQIHSHMCYSDFSDMLGTIESMDADVITIETARSGNSLLKVFQKSGYKNEIGPGVYDIHSPRIPSFDEIESQIRLLLEVLPQEQLWINPDCGLKTRSWKEVRPALTNMVKAAISMR